jgi:TetR/AcrR family transcriptional regulator, mexJK operon transcriptional repressor
VASERQALRASSKKEQIARAARALFLAQGYAATSMDAVSAEARVSKQTLYSYFPSKAELLAEILVEEIDSMRISDVRVTSFATMADLRHALLVLADRLTSQWLADDAQQLLRLVVGEAVRLPELRDVVREVLPGQLLHEVEGLILVAVDSGLVCAPRPDLSARMFLGPVMSFVTLDGLFRADRAIPPDRESLAFVVDAFLATLRVDGSP